MLFNSSPNNCAFSFYVLIEVPNKNGFFIGRHFGCEYEEAETKVKIKHLNFVLESLCYFCFGIVILILC